MDFSLELKVNLHICFSSYEYYENNPNLHDILGRVVELIRKNRYVCVTCAKNQNNEYEKFFLNKDLLESLKRDLPYLFR